MELVGTKNNIIKDGMYDIKFENVKSIEEVDLDVIIVPGSKSNKFYENEEFEKLLNNIKMKKVFEKSEETMWEWLNCGYLVIGIKAPEVCPVCNYAKGFFEVRAENY